MEISKINDEYKKNNSKGVFRFQLKENGFSANKKPFQEFG